MAGGLLGMRLDAAEVRSANESIRISAVADTLRVHKARDFRESVRFCTRFRSRHLVPSLHFHFIDT
jgi:hypothetical protein